VRFGVHGEHGRIIHRRQKIQHCTRARWSARYISTRRTRRRRQVLTMLPELVPSILTMARATSCDARGAFSIEDRHERSSGDLREAANGPRISLVVRTACQRALDCISTKAYRREFPIPCARSGGHAHLWGMRIFEERHPIDVLEASMLPGPVALSGVDDRTDCSAPQHGTRRGTNG